ncbi:MAG: dihydrofolate reductase-like protein [Microgenomates group bacterium Gr01-1014_7]|nr:MAG: dihydrofolate reductase-like protein [Microgenomates group bacterium Gr01-1014_7]
MKVVLSVATSLNGIIATEDGSEDFLSHENWLAFVKLAQKIGNNIWGRKTYQTVKNWPKEYFNSLNSVVKVIISTDESLELLPGFTRVSSPQEAIGYLSSQGFKEALVTGGSTIYSSFLRENLVDEIIVDVNPTILGKGIAAFDFEGSIVRMKPIKVKKLKDGIMEIYYKVLK